MTNDPKLNAIIEAIMEQRNAALDNCAMLKGELVDTNRQLAESNQSISVLSDKIAELQKKLDSPEQT